MAVFETRYSNLRREMANKNLTNVRLASALKISRSALRNKFAGKSSFTLDEALIIQKYFFPEHSLEYLFTGAETDFYRFKKDAANAMVTGIIDSFKKARVTLNVELIEE